MNYWVTTHWPRRAHLPDDSPHEGVWVPDGRHDVINRVNPGDMVFIYETQSGRTEIQINADGTTTKFPRRRGLEGIVALVCVTEKAYQLEDSAPDTYTDGTTVWWRYYAPTTSVNSVGFIPRRQAATLLGYSEEYVFRGYGEGHTGLKEIEKDRFDRLLAAFVASAEVDEKQKIERARQSRFGRGGEGPVHLALKNRIAADPAGVLDEEGLKLWAVEWGLSTGDCIDVVLKDRFDRFVSVEVEVDCTATEMPGPLQCMKYRAMLSYFFNRPCSEIRTILAAHSIHSDLRKRCESHLIQCHEIPRLSPVAGPVVPQVACPLTPK
jgi:hypothetical protein